jgi:hypothetical protein
VSVKRRSTNFTSLSLISFNTSSGVVAMGVQSPRAGFGG